MDILTRTSSVLVEVREERARQEAKFPEQHLPDGTGPDFAWAFTGPASWVAECAKQETDRLADEQVLTWKDVALEEVAEAFAESDPARLRAELIQVAAVAARWVEDIDRRAGEQAAVPAGEDA